MIEPEITGTDILYDLYGTTLPRKEKYGPEDHLVDGLSNSEFQDILSSSNEELEAKMIRVAYHPGFYSTKQGKQFIYKDYPSGLLAFVTMLGMSFKDYHSFFLRYSYIKSTFEKICLMRSQGFSLEFHSGLPEKYIPEMGRLFQKVNMGSYYGVVTPDHIGSSAETKSANILQRLRKGRKVIDIGDDRYLADLFTRLGPVECYLIDNPYHPTPYKGLMTPEIAQLPVQGEIYRGYTFEEALSTLALARANP